LIANPFVYPQDCRLFPLAEYASVRQSESPNPKNHLGFKFQVLLPEFGKKNRRFFSPFLQKSFPCHFPLESKSNRIRVVTLPEDFPTMINIRMQSKDVKKLTPKITVIGVGGAGGNAVNNMIHGGLQGVDFLVCNTDAQALEGSLCDTRLQLGVEVTGGLGAGARPEVGRSAAEESLDDVLRYLDGANMVFITAGMGGGTGTGAAPVIARACREKGILTVGVVTKPFHFEGTLRMRMAEAGIDSMQDYVDTLIVIPNQNLFRVANEKTTFSEAFRMADGVLQSAVRGVTDLMVRPGDVNLDFADIRSVMLEMGKAMMGTGEAVGDRRAIEAAEKAINNPLLDDVSMKGARAVIINVTGGADMTLFEVDEACNRIRDEVDPNANIIFGSTYDPALEGLMRVSVVATGIDVAETKSAAKPTTFVSTAPRQQQAQQLQQAQSQHDRRIVQPSPMELSVPHYAPPPPIVRTPASSVIPPLPLNVRPVPQASAPVEMPVAAESFDMPAMEVRSPVAKKAEPVSHEGSLRGTIYNEAFIPPAPIEADQRSRESGYGPQFGAGLSARRPDQPVSQPLPASSGGLTLKPPVLPGVNAPVQPKKRAASPFERFISQLRTSGEGNQPAEREEKRAERAPEPAISRPPLQGSLNIEPPRASEPEDELDIPAFLRRQAN
jgi:cell division protein FtsZ